MQEAEGSTKSLGKKQTTVHGDMDARGLTEAKVQGTGHTHCSWRHGCKRLNSKEALNP
jgi:hypothetical protein